MTDRYRKKPVVVEAMQFEGSEESAESVINWMGADDEGFLPGPCHWTAYLIPPTDGEDTIIIISTLEGQMQADPGDWIIKGVQGEFYPCDPDIFEATYELVEDNDD